jgi:formylglycine-generating enzyme required for sulfatase activity
LLRELIVQGDSGTRRFGVDDCPLVVGGSSRSQIRLPGAGSRDEPLLIGVSEGKIFAQQGEGDDTVKVNAVALTASRWLADGDELQIGGSRINFSLTAAGAVLKVDPEQRDDDTLPPLILEAPPAQGRIEAVPYATPQEALARGRSPSRPIGRRVLVVLTIAVVAVLVWYTFTGVSVRVLVDPQPDALDIDGGLFALHFGDRYLLRPGEYDLRVEKAGYRSLEEHIEVGRESNQTVRYRLLKLPGKVSFTSSPEASAEVFVDGVSIGQTPIADAEIEAGAHLIELRAPRYLVHEGELEVEGMGQPQTLEVELIPAWAPVLVSSIPDGANVVYEGVEQGLTPITLELLQGPQRLTLRQSGYDESKVEFEVIANQPLELAPVELVKSKAKLTLESKPAGATVSVDGRFVGHTPTEVALTPGEAHQLVFSRAGYDTHREAIILEPGEVAAFAVDLKAITGSIDFRVEPVDAELLVDGRSRGKAKQTLWLAAVPHKVEIRKRGYQTYRTTVTPRPGFEQALRVSLSPTTGAAPGSSANVITNSQGQVLRRVSPAEFLVGSSRREQGRRSNETRRKVILNRPFYLGVEEVSNAEYRRFDPSHRSGTAGGTSIDLDDQPVVNVGWDQAARYCNWLSQREDLPLGYAERGGKMVMVTPMTKGYRLPTEAEWVRAARYTAGGSGIKYPWGGRWPPLEGSGNYADASAKSLIASSLSGYDDGFVASAPGGSFGANELGVYDLGGNVAEWVNDIYIIPSAGAAAIENPMGPVEGKHHTIRGASWRDSSMSRLRFSYRDYGREGRSDVGFRIARYAD